jgi:hypothetical protein
MISMHRTDIGGCCVHDARDPVCPCVDCDRARRQRINERCLAFAAERSLAPVSTMRSIASNDQDDPVNTVVDLNLARVGGWR